MPKLRAYFPEAALVLAAVLYGATFTIVQDALHDMTAEGFNVVRFALGAVVLAPFALHRGWRGPAPRSTDSARTVVIGGAVIGAVAAVAYLTQNIGLEHTTTSNSAFITGLFAVTTPLVESVTYRRLPRRGIAVAVAISVVGLFVLTGAQFELGFGDAITLVTAAAIGVWYVLVGAYANRVDVVTLTAVQLGAVAMCSLPIAAVTGFGHISSRAVLALVFTGIGCSAVAFSLSTWAQRVVDPSRASLINLLEPIVAGIVGYAVGERLGLRGYAGAALILAAILVAEAGAHAAEVGQHVAASLDRAVKSSGE